MMRVSFLHTISPIALKGKERVKEMINALPDYAREKALELLLEEKSCLNASGRECSSVPGTAHK